MTQKRSPRLDLTPAGRMEEAGLQKVLGYQLAQAVLVTDAIFFEQVGKPFNLRPVEYTVLTLIAENPGGSLVRLARALSVTPPNISTMVDRLEAKGLVRRVRSSEDRRVVNLELTDEGRVAAKQIPATLCRVQNAHMKGFTHEEWETLKGLLRRILVNAQEIQAERIAADDK